METELTSECCQCFRPVHSDDSQKRWVHDPKVTTTIASRLRQTIVVCNHKQQSHDWNHCPDNFRTAVIREAAAKLEQYELVVKEARAYIAIPSGRGRAGAIYRTRQALDALDHDAGSPGHPQ